MKYIVLLVALAAIAPLTQLLKGNPVWEQRAWFTIGLLAFLVSYFPILNVAVVTFPFWSGYAYGIEITAIDILALAIYISQPRTNRFLFWFPLTLYFVAVLLTMFYSDVPMATSFYVWQVARVIFLAVVTSHRCARPENRDSLINGLMLGLIVEMFFVVWQRFALGILQTPGTFAHQNLLGIALHFVFFPLLLLVLDRHSKLLEYVALFSVAVTVSLTASRATVGMSLLGVVLSVILSISRGSTPRKWRALVVAVMGLLLIAPLAWTSFEQRFKDGSISFTMDEKDERILLENAARAIVADHPLGIGANMFVPYANTHGYYDQVELGWHSRGTSVHNVYLLVLAETGYIGLVSFLFVLASVFVRAILTGFRSQSSEVSSLSLGFAVSIFIVALHSLYEWILVTSAAQTFLALAIGLVSALSARHPQRPE